MRKRLNSKLAISLGLGIPESSGAVQSSVPLATEASREAAPPRRYGICKTRAHTWVTPGIVRRVGRRIREYSATPSDFPWLYDPRSRFYEFVRKKRLHAETSSPRNVADALGNVFFHP